MRSLRKAAAAATILVLTSFAAGCGGDDDGDDADDPKTVTVTETSDDATTATTEATTDATTDATPMDPMDTSGDITLEQVNAALLTPEEVGAGLTLGQWSNEDSPPPCDPSGTPADVQVPPDVEGGVQINTADGNAQMEEEIAVYVDDATAGEAYAIGTAGLGCTTATLDDGTTFEIGPATDVTAEVNGASGVGTSTAWEISGEGVNIVLVATLAGRIVMANTFLVAEGADTSALPTPLEIAALAWNKALAN